MSSQDKMITMIVTFLVCLAIVIHGLFSRYYIVRVNDKCGYKLDRLTGKTWLVINSFPKSAIGLSVETKEISFEKAREASKELLGK